MHTQTELLAIAETCFRVRRDIGHVFLTPERSEARENAREVLRASLCKLLEDVREHDQGLFLEVAAEIGSSA